MPGAVDAGGDTHSPQTSGITGQGLAVRACPRAGISHAPSPQSRTLKPSHFNALQNNQRHQPGRMKNHPHTALTRRHGEGARTATEAAFGGGRAGRLGRRVFLRGDASGWSRGRFTQCDKALALEAGGPGRQARAEIARAVRRVRQPSARRGPPSERVKNPRSEGFRKTAARSARLRRNGPTLQTLHRARPGRFAPSPFAQRFPRERETSRVCRGRLRELDASVIFNLTPSRL